MKNIGNVEKVSVKKVSVILPCLNEEKGIGICIKKIKQVFNENLIDGEIIVVDNGSSDKTFEIAKSFNVKVVYEPRKGYGRAYLTGFKEAHGDVVIMGDGDNSYDFYEIPRFLNELENFNIDFVIGNRKVIMKNASPFLHRSIGRPFFSFLLKLLFNIKISDSHCGFGAIKKEPLNKLNLKSDGMEFASEILIKAKKQNLKIKEIPIVYYKRIGKSKLRTFRDGTRHLKLILKEKFN